MSGNPAIWINDLKIVTNEIFLIDGGYTGKAIFGHDTLPDAKTGQQFVTQFESGRLKLSMPCKGRILGVDQNFFCVVEMDRAFSRQSVSKFDFKNNRIWKYSLSLKDSVGGTLVVHDVCFDDLGNTYVLFVIRERGEIRLMNDEITGPANVIVKISENGQLLSFRKISETGRYIGLRMKDNKVCAYGAGKACVMDRDLKEEIQGDELSELIKFSLWDKGNYFRIEQDGSRPIRLFYVEKYIKKSKLIERKEIFQDTLRFQDEIYQYDILNLDRNKILCVYVSRGDRADLNVKHINVLVIKKKNLDMVNHIVIDCDRLDVGTTGQSSSIAFQVFRGDLLIGNNYIKYCRIGNIEFGNKDNSTIYPSFFIVKQPLK